VPATLHYGGRQNTVVVFLTLSHQNDTISVKGHQLTTLTTNDSDGEQLSHTELMRLIGKINDKALSNSERTDAKNQLLMAHVDFIWRKVRARTKGKIGIEDSLTELGDSVFHHLLMSATNIANHTQDASSLESAIAQRIKTWSIEKIRRRKAQKRGYGRQHSSDVTYEIHGRELAPDEALEVEEAHQFLTKNVDEAVEQLDGLEQTVILSYFGFNEPELTLEQVAEELDLEYTVVHNAKRRAYDKLRKWLKDTNISDAKALDSIDRNLTLNDAAPSIDLTE
jgi:RNA polymerase sigma factor (sigma-70 family)